ncbi:MAG: hypothetical protein LBC95_01710 [Candidatus Nomurabacteria bacterium]|jgi:hypothetical protein|nr:hypothetical protein [Candidatus Nomurabacteria bacterium]
MSRKSKGSIIPNGVAIWSHEMAVAQILANAGHTVEFIPVNNAETNSNNPDILMDNKIWEIKSPKTDKLSGIERNLKRASHQSAHIILHSGRIKRLHNDSIQSFLIKKFRQQKNIESLLYIDRHHKIIDISRLV